MVLGAFVLFKNHSSAMALLIEEAGNCISLMPELFLISLIAVDVLAFLFVSMIRVISAIHVNGTEIIGSSNWCLFIQFFHLIWMSELVLACQQLILSAAVTTLYYHPAESPVRHSVGNLLMYRMGVAAKGSILRMLMDWIGSVVMCVVMKLVFHPCIASNV